jgi:hypothetical protein
MLSLLGWQKNTTIPDQGIANEMELICLGQGFNL